MHQHCTRTALAERHPDLLLSLKRHCAAVICQQPFLRRVVDGVGRFPDDNFQWGVISRRCYLGWRTTTTPSCSVLVGLVPQRTNIPFVTGNESMNLSLDLQAKKAREKESIGN